MKSEVKHVLTILKEDVVLEKCLLPGDKVVIKFQADCGRYRILVICDGEETFEEGESHD